MSDGIRFRRSTKTWVVDVTIQVGDYMHLTSRCAAKTREELIKQWPKQAIASLRSSVRGVNRDMRSERKR